MRFSHILGATIATAALTLVSGPAVAQAPQPNQRGFIVGVGGLTATQVNSAVLGATAGVNVTRDLQITIDAGRMLDVQAPFTHDDLALLDAGVSAVGDIPLTSTVKMPTNFVTGGVRYLIPVRGPVRPYVAGAAGIAHMSPKPTFTALGIDVTSPLMADPEVGLALTNTFREETKPMASVSGGVMVTVARHLNFDLGYRYSSIFIKTDYLQANGVAAGISPHDHTRINVHRVYAGVGVGF